jgi:hypothetical protein
MKKLCFWMAMTVLIFANISCEKIVGEGPVITEERNTAPFEGLSVSVPSEAHFTRSDDYSITLQAQRNILDEIETTVSGGILKIRFRHPNARIRSHEKIIIHVTGPVARLLELSGSGTLDVDGPIDPAELEINSSGSGSIHVDEVLANKIRVVLSGSGRITVEDGKANEKDVTISGSGFVDLSEVQAKDVSTRISGSGNVEVHATHTLKVRISGSGTVFYKGNPAIDSQISGSGSVVKM